MPSISLRLFLPALAGAGLGLSLLLAMPAVAGTGTTPPPAEAAESASSLSSAGTAPSDDTLFKDGITVQIGNRQPITFVPTLLTYLTQSYVKLTGVDLADDKLIDDFAAINYCRLVTEYYKDEFAWRQAREAIRATITRNLEQYPEYFYVLGTLQLGRYDFAKQAFMLDPGHVFKRTGVFNVNDRKTDCPTSRIQTVDRVPVEFSFRLTNPITLSEIKVPEKTAFAVTRALEQKKNDSRVVYVVFFMRVNDFSTVTVKNAFVSNSSVANVRATLLSMRLYLDYEHKIQFFEYSGD